MAELFTEGDEVIFGVTGDDIVGGKLPEIPAGTTKILIHNFDGTELPDIDNPPSSLKKIEVTLCENLTVLPRLTEGLEEVSCSLCDKLNMIGEMPSTVKRLEINSCKKIEYIPDLPESLEQPGSIFRLPANLEIIVITLCESLKELGHFPETVKEVNISYCKEITEIPALPEGLKKINGSHLTNLRSVPRLSTTLETIDFSYCPLIESFPSLTETGVRYLDLSGCKNLQTILENIPLTLRYLDLNGCSKLIKTPGLEARLVELQLTGSVGTRYPEHFLLEPDFDKSEVPGEENFSELFTKRLNLGETRTNPKITDNPATSSAVADSPSVVDNSPGVNPKNPNAEAVIPEKQRDK